MKPKTEQATQLEKFKQAARELETDESEENFDRVLKRLAKTDAKPSSKRKPSQHLRSKSPLGD